MKSPVDHPELVARAARWLETNGHGVVITEMASGSPEHPDAIGFKGSHSTLIECKVSRADFLADAKKWFRRMPGSAMGTWRYFAAPAGMLQPEEIPAPWGLMETYGRGLRVVREAQPVSDGTRQYEVSLLCSALRRITTDGQGRVAAVRCKLYQFEGEGDPRATIGIGIDPEPHPGQGGEVGA